MALKNNEGNYLKIDSYNLENETVNTLTYENEEHRVNGDGEFLKHKNDTLEVKGMKEVANEVLLILSYLKLKEINGFPEWSDDIVEEQKEKIEKVKTFLEEWKELYLPPAIKEEKIDGMVAPVSDYVEEENKEINQEL